MIKKSILLFCSLILGSLFLAKSAKADPISTPIQCGRNIEIASISGLENQTVGKSEMTIEVTLWTKFDFESYYLEIKPIFHPYEDPHADPYRNSIEPFYPISLEQSGEQDSEGREKVVVSFLILDTRVLLPIDEGMARKYDVIFSGDERFSWSNPLSGDPSCNIGSYDVEPSKIFIPIITNPGEDPEPPPEGETPSGCGTILDHPNENLKMCVIDGTSIPFKYVVQCGDSQSCCRKPAPASCISPPISAVTCGTVQTPANTSEELCLIGGNQYQLSDVSICQNPWNCCLEASQCKATDPANGGIGGSDEPGIEDDPGIEDITAGPTSLDSFDEFNPLKMGNADGSKSKYVNQLSSPGGIVSRILLFAFPLAGLILFAMLSWAGFEMLAGASSEKSLDAGKQRATAAILGFLLLFVSYWIMQIVEVIFGITIL